MKPYAVATTMLILLAAGAASCSRDTTVVYHHEAVWRMPTSEDGIPAPRSLCTAANGELYVLDTIGRVLVFSPQGTLARQWRMPESTVGRPEGITTLSDGSLLVADTHYHRMVRFSVDGDLLATWGSHGTDLGEFIYPVAVTRGPSNTVFVAEYGGNDRIQVFTEDGSPRYAFGSFGTGDDQFQRCSGLAYTEGRLYVADAINNRIQVYTAKGKRLASIHAPGGSPLRFPYDIVVAAERQLAIVEYSAGRVTLIDTEGVGRGHYGHTGRGIGSFATPWGIAADDRGRLYVADTGNHRIVVLTP